MEHAPCSVLYVDRNVREDRYLNASKGDSVASVEGELGHIAENVKLLLDVFGEVHLISTGGACLSQWLDLQDTSVIELKPTLILIDTPFGDKAPERLGSRTPSPQSLSLPEDEEGRNHEEDLYGLALLQRIVSESYLRNLSKLVVPVPIIVFPQSTCAANNDENCDTRDEIANRKLHPDSPKLQRTENRRMLKRCLDLGATDVMASPMNVKCITNLEVHAYRAHRDAAQDQKALLEVRRGRKRSWVGISDEKPFAYLREAMVSGLMSRICRIQSGVDDPVGVKISIPVDRQAAIAGAVGHWHFCAHDFSDDELIVAASVMFKHALSAPELEQWRIPTDHLHSFLIACRAAYNAFVPYHNFRHVVDVLQATFHFLVSIGTLPPFPPRGDSPTAALPKKSPITELLGPFEALTLLITAIGHDVGHPGVNNGFLTKLNAPLAQLYNDRSVLESFHCAAYSQILRRHWPAAFEFAKMRNLMISSILATDMGLHFEYMKKLESLQTKLRDGNNTEEWNESMIDEQKALACALLIKCADISNVARNHETAVQWMFILCDEFSRQASMEAELSIPTSLMAPPKKEMIALGKAQLGFMKFFVMPLFQGVADILPGMQYCLDELAINQTTFEAIVAGEHQEQQQQQEPQEQQKHGQQREPGNQEQNEHQITRRPEWDDNVSPKTTTIIVGSGKKEVLSPAPTVLRSGPSTEEDFLTHQANPVERLPQVPQFNAAYKEANGLPSDFDPAAEFAASDPFNINGDKHERSEQQRCSETTEGSSVPCSGDWASGPTSATTGKMPLSPSTRGTSIVSRDSLDRPYGIPTTIVTAPESTTTAPTEPARSQPDLKIESNSSTDTSEHSVPLAEVDADAEAAAVAAAASVAANPSGSCKALRKKPSRFRIGALPFFRRHKSSSPPVPATDTAG